MLLHVAILFHITWTISNHNIYFITCEVCSPWVHYPSLWIWKGVSATLQSGRYTLLYSKRLYVFNNNIYFIPCGLCFTVQGPSSLSSNSSSPVVIHPSDNNYFSSPKAPLCAPPAHAFYPSQTATAQAKAAIPGNGLPPCVLIEHGTSLHVFTEDL